MKHTNLVAGGGRAGLENYSLKGEGAEPIQLRARGASAGNPLWDRSTCA